MSDHRLPKPLDTPLAQPDAPLVNYDAARTALARAKTVDDVKSIRNTAEAFRAYAKIAGDRSMEWDAIEIRVCAERRLGQMIVAQREEGKLARGGGDQRSKHRVKRKPGGPITLPEAGISKSLAHTGRKLAALSDQEFEQFIVGIRKGERMTDLKQAARMQAREREVDEHGAARDPRAYNPFITGDLDEDSLPPTFETALQKYEWALRNNLSSPNLPANADSVAKVVADALCRLHLLTEFMDMPGARAKFIDIMDRVENRLLRIEQEVVTERGWSKPD